MSLLPLACVGRVFWMHALPIKMQLVPKEYRTKIALTEKWVSTMKYFQKIPGNPSGMTGDNVNEEADEDKLKGGETRRDP